MTRREEDWVEGGRRRSSRGKQTRNYCAASNDCGNLTTIFTNLKTIWYKHRLQ